MKYVLLDGVPPEALLALGLIYIVLPIAALMLLIYFFNKWRKKRTKQNHGE
jgi:hypothetical protein